MNAKQIQKILFALLLLSMAHTGQAEIPPAPALCQLTTQTYSNSNSINIPDANLAISEIQVNTEVGLSIFDVNVTTNIQHANTGDLKLYLIPPTGRVIVLGTDNGAGFSNVYNGTIWDDDAGNVNAPGAVTDVTMANNVIESVVVPESAMATMLGINPNGKWQLYVYDSVAGNTGVLNGWSLEITTTLDVPKTESFTATNTTPVAINDLSTVNSTVQFTSNVTVYQVKVTTQLQHTYNGDLDITLTSPSGTAVTLTTDNGGSFDNIFANKSFFDKGYYPITDIDFSVIIPESYIPEEAMGAFIGESALGTWTLSITDDANNDIGTLSGWTLEVIPATCRNSLVFDNFNDSVLSPDYDYVKGIWNESNGSLNAPTPAKKALVLITPPAGPCSDCNVHTVMRWDNALIQRVSLFALYQDRGNKIELMMKGDKNLWILKEFAGGKMVKKMKFNELFAVGTNHDVRLEYNSQDNSITFYRGDFAYGTMQLLAQHQGIFGYQVKGTSAYFNSLSIEAN